MLRPIDIQNKEFEKKIKGYDCDAVDDFLDVIIEDYDALCKENQALAEKVEMLTQTVAHYKDMDEAMQRSLEVAQQSAQDIKNNAQIEAEAIINRAKLDATRLARQIDDEHIKKHQEMLRVKQEVETYRARIRTVCENLVKALDEI